MLYFGPLVLTGLQCYCGDSRNKIQISFKKLFFTERSNMALAKTFWITMPRRLHEPHPTYNQVSFSTLHPRDIFPRHEDPH